MRGVRTLKYPAPHGRFEPRFMALRRRRLPLPIGSCCADAAAALQVSERKQFSVACVPQQSECGVHHGRLFAYPLQQISFATAPARSTWRQSPRAQPARSPRSASDATRSRPATRGAPPNHGRIHRRAGCPVSLASLSGKATWRAPDRGRRWAGDGSVARASIRKEGHVSLHKRNAELCRL
jgi:hypothetical protein